jgi:hypothetical protein
MAVANGKVDLRGVKVDHGVGRVELQVDVWVHRLKTPHARQQPLSGERHCCRDLHYRTPPRCGHPTDGGGKAIKAVPEDGVQRLRRRRQLDLPDAPLEKRHADVASSALT